MAGRARRSIFALYLASAVFVTVQQGVVGRSNNFKVFRAAAVNLLAHRDLYAAHPDQHFDFYKYSPTFALLFAPFAALPFALALLPLVVIPPHELVAQYRSWWTIELSDASRVNRGDSVMQFLYRWVGADWPLWPVQLAGTLLLLAPLARERERWADRAFRLRFLCSLLVYLVLFNHQSERASFVIAYAGLAIWYAASAPDRLRNAIALAAVIALVLQDVQIVPWAVHDALGQYRVKVIPCLVASIVMQTELLGSGRWSPRLHGPEVRQADIPPPEPLAYG